MKEGKMYYKCITNVCMIICLKLWVAGVGGESVSLSWLAQLPDEIQQVKVRAGRYMMSVTCMTTSEQQ